MPIMMLEWQRAGHPPNALGHYAGKLVRFIWNMLTNEVEINLN